MASEQAIGNAWIAVHAKADSSFNSEVNEMFGGAGEEAGGVFNSKLGGVLKKLPAVFAAVKIGGMLKDFVADSVEVGKAFDKSMSQVAATMGKTMEEISADVVTVGDFTGNLRDFAQHMGATTGFSATEAADALNYMALAGYDAKTSMEMLPTVLNLATAGNIELARASDMVTDAQSALGLSIDQTTVMVDQMAKTASTTNTSVEQLGDAFLTVGGTAKMLQGGTAELSQVLGLLADNGIKGSEGGTALRNMLLALSAPSAAASQTIEELGLHVFDAEGNMRSMQDIILDMNAAMSDMTDEQRVQAISSIFNARDLKSVNALLGTSAERWDQVAGAIDDAAGSAEQMAATQFDNLAGDVTMMESAMEGLQIKISDMVAPALRSLYQFAGKAFSGMTQFINDNQETFDALANVISTVMGGALTVVSAAFRVLGGVIQFVIDTLSPLFDLLGAVGEFFAALFGEGGETDQAIEHVGEAFAALPAKIGEALLNAMTHIGEWIIELGAKAPEAGAQFINGLLAGLGAAASALWSWFSELPGRIVEAIGNPLEILKNVGAQMIQGAIDGIGSLAGALWDKVSGIFQGAVVSAEVAVDSHSPSRVFRELGQNMVIGAQLGVEDEELSFHQTVASTFTGAIDAAPVGYAGASYGPTINIANMNVQADDVDGLIMDINRRLTVLGVM